MNKEDLIQTIKSWVTLDNEIRSLKEEIKIRKMKKDELSGNLISTMKNNEIDSFDINNGSLEYKKNTTKKALSKKMLLNILNSYYSGDENKVKELTEFINENRELDVKENLVRKIKH